MKRIFSLYIAVLFLTLDPGRAVSAPDSSVNRLKEMVFSYIEGDEEWLNGRNWYGPPISEYTHRSALKTVMLPAFESENTLLSVIVEDLSDRGYSRPSVGLTFLPMLSHSFGKIPLGAIFQSYPAEFNPDCIVQTSCDRAQVKKTIVKYLTDALVRNGSEFRWGKPDELSSDLNDMEFSLEYEDIYIFTFSKESCPGSCVQEFDVLITGIGEILGARVVKELIVETL
jgi:hypothetical protein